MRRSSSRALVVVMLTAVGCSRREPPTVARGPELLAIGEIVDASGVPIPSATIESYRLTFEVDGNEVVKTYAEDGDASVAGIQADASGVFRIVDAPFVLTHEWQEDVWVCEDVCTEYQTTCAWVDEEVCTPVCEDVVTESCYDECYDDCVTTCEDVTTCDDSGCWTDTVCSDDCTTVCEPVCEQVVEQQCVDDCQIESHEECTDECIATEQQCGYQTFYHADPVALADVDAATAEITYRDAKGEAHTAKGAALVSAQQETCPADRSVDACEPFDLWVQRDRFSE